MDRGAADQNHEDVVSGILCRIGSGLSFSTMGAMLKLASIHGFNAPELVFYRSVFALPVVLAWVLRRENLRILKPNRAMPHVWRGAMGIVSMGQYLQPTPRHAKVAEFVTPDAFKAYAAIARAKGFLLVAASPLTRSSYHAGDDFMKLRTAREAKLAKA